VKRREVLQAGMALGGLAGLGRALAQGGFTLTLVHTNDTHAHLEPVELTLSGEKTPVGGVARRVALFDRVWARAKNPLFLDAGDVFQGTLYFNQYRGLADRYFMHRLRYRAMALGNHEFDLGPGPLADFLKGARFKVVSANVDASREPRLKGPLRRGRGGRGAGGDHRPHHPGHQGDLQPRAHRGLPGPL
jgi:5'-nucleotidase/UDP-sugar diphosphatase